MQNRKIDLDCKVIIKKDTPIQINVTPANDLPIYSNLDICYKSDVIPEIAKNRPLEKDKVLAQISKTTDSIYNFKNIH